MFGKLGCSLAHLGILKIILASQTCRFKEGMVAEVYYNPPRRRDLSVPATR